MSSPVRIGSLAMLSAIGLWLLLSVVSGDGSLVQRSLIISSTLEEDTAAISAECSLPLVHMSLHGIPVDHADYVRIWVGRYAYSNVLGLSPIRWVIHDDQYRLLHIHRDTHSMPMPFTLLRYSDEQRPLRIVHHQQRVLLNGTKRVVVELLATEEGSLRTVGEMTIELPCSP